MESLYILIPIAVVLVFVGIALFIWAVKTEQFEDAEKHGMSILFDEPDKPCAPTQPAKRHQDDDVREQKKEV